MPTGKHRSATRWERHVKRARRREKSLVALTAHAAARATAGVALAGALFVNLPADMTFEHAPSTTRDGTSDAERLMARHDCWTEDAPSNPTIPTKAVVTLPGDDPALVPSEVGFGIWLDDEPGTLHAFCD